VFLSTALLATVATSTGAVEVAPAALKASLSTYQSCLFGGIDRQYEDKASRFSEQKVLAHCANVHRKERRSAEAALAQAMSPAERRSNLIERKFAEMDASVWNIVGHLRAKRMGRP